MVEYILAAGGEKRRDFYFTREHGLAIRSLATKYTGPYLQKIFGPEFDYEAIRARRKQLMKEHIEKNGIEKKPDVDEILDYLRSKNIKTAVATATDPERTKQYLTQIGIYDKFGSACERHNRRERKNRSLTCTFMHVSRLGRNQRIALRWKIRQMESYLHTAQGFLL